LGTASGNKFLFLAEVIPHKDQRYETCGDWQFLSEGLRIRVSDTGDHASNMLVAIHELIEATLCRECLVSENAIDDFDKFYEQNRNEDSLPEPGNSPLAPYHRQHLIADIVERLVASQAGVNWQIHDARVEAL
jgi:hypothetical protein